MIAPSIVLASCAASSENPTHLGLTQGYVDGASIFSDQAFHIEAQRLKAEAEEQVRVCMKEQGFDYQPKEYRLEDNDPIAYDQVEGVSEEEFAERWGFGILFPDDVEVDGRADDPDYVIFDESSSSDQPLDQIVDLAERDAYERALLGTSEDDPGCEFPAHEEYRQFGFEYGQRFGEIMELRGQFAVGEDMERYYIDWSECMEGEGYSFVSPLHALVSFQERLPSGDVDFEDQRQVAIATVRCDGSVLNFLPDELLNPWGEFVASRTS